MRVQRLAVLLLAAACTVPAWLAIGLMAAPAHRCDVTGSDASMLACARALREQVAPSPSAGAPGAPPGVDWEFIAQVPITTAGAAMAAPPSAGAPGVPLEALARAASGGSDWGVLHARRADGEPMVMVFSRLETSPALTVVGLAERALLADQRRWTERWWIAVGLALLTSVAAATGLAWQLTRTNAGYARAAAAQAETARLLQQRTRERDEALRAQADLASETRRDPLTRLANRTAFLHRLESSIEAQRRIGGHVTAFFIDLDNFKAVNDRFGHAAGDALLCAFAARLLGGVRQGDMVARLAGDEFAVLIEGLPAGEAEPIARALLERLSLPYRLADRDLRMSASIGLASFPDDAGDAAALLGAADAAMYAAKSAGKGDFRCSGWGSLPLLHGIGDAHPSPAYGAPH